MPLTFRIDADRGVIWTHGTGEIKDDDVFALKRAIQSDPAYRPEFRQVSDLREVSRLTVTSAGVMQMAGMDAGQPGGGAHRLAIVANQDLVFGMARMYQARASEHRPDVGVFRDLAEACAWLGIPVEAAEPPNR